MALELAYVKEYPEAQTYRGKAFYSSVEFTSIKLPFVDNIYEWLARTIIEKEVATKGGRMLRMEVRSEPTSWRGIPAIRFVVNYWFYMPALGLSVSIATAIAIAQAIIFLLTVIAIAWSIREVKELVWGYEETPSIFKYALPIAILLGVGAYLVYALRRK